MKDLKTYVLETKKISSIDDYVLEGFKLGKNKVDKEENDFVDLDLPSKTLWGKYNVGAKPGSTAESWYGDYFMWGDPEPATNKTCYWKIYKWCNNGNVKRLTKYCYDNDYNNDYWDYFAKKCKQDNKSVLDEEDDMARVNMGDEWKMPTEEQCIELIDNTTKKQVKDYNDILGLNGTLFISKKNGNKLFIPAAGYNNRGIIEKKQEFFNIWTSNLAKNYSKNAICFDNIEIGIDSFNRFYGFSVRGVLN